MKVAIVHDWFSAKGGAETCIEQLLHIFPQADLFATIDFMAEEDRGFLAGRRVKTSFIQRLPGAQKHYRSYLPLMPIAIEQLDVTGYDLVISTSSAVAKGVITGPDQVHVSYIYSPIRYAWDLQHQYLAESGLAKGLKSVFARALLHYIRMWDVRTAHNVDRFVGISEFIARRIRKAYGRQADVIYPPVDISRFTMGPQREDFFVTMSRMVPYKRIPLIVEAFRHLPDKKLIVIGDGPEMPAVKKAAGSNVTIMGRQPDDVVVSHLQRAKAFLFAAEEDFGIAPLEAQACGTPVIAYGKGGALETIRGAAGEGRTGVFFSEQTAEAIVAAITEFEAVSDTISTQACRNNAERFSQERFRNEFREMIDHTLIQNLKVSQLGEWKSLAETSSEIHLAKHK